MSFSNYSIRLTVDKLTNAKVCVRCGERMPLHPNGLCGFCLTELVRETRREEKMLRKELREKKHCGEGDDPFSFIEKLGVEEIAE